MFPGSLKCNEQILDPELEENSPGLKWICRLLAKVEDDDDVWLVYEHGGQRTLAARLFEIRGESRGNGEKVYEIHHKEFFSVI